MVSVVALSLERSTKVAKCELEGDERVDRVDQVSVREVVCPVVRVASQRGTDKRRSEGRDVHIALW